MPLVNHQPFNSPWPLFNGHLQTVFPSIFRKINGITYQRERIHTPDHDFLDLDWASNNNERLVILSHGLEGSSQGQYIKGMVRAFQAQHWDCLAWNYRGCSGEPNQTEKAYHSGATYDLNLVVQHVLKKEQYKEIALIGFSLGGNLTLKYLGEQARNLSPLIKKAVVFSVPLYLLDSSWHLAKKSNFIYAQRFLIALKKKARQKAEAIPDKIDTNQLKGVKTIMDFDDRFTAPIHGFNGAEDYYKKCSSINFVEEIQIPTLVVNAGNDPMLPETCYPIDFFKGLKNVYFEMPQNGGHCGFTLPKNGNPLIWSEMRAIDFIVNNIT
ncbi:YheT family hydrolase [Xanthovirga aplysinae]|uniref:YheT family hydrolase n=1 Tax=Xanthovirga aplysinae TaxID=2529853 RepID=UPI0012BD79D7|nr:alpha/beta fold hydrolase [Xanthovirga aplysinae]MTI30072.1 alpha/beta fold hydrolase [Xanthovirga aplysinae]